MTEVFPDLRSRVSWLKLTYFGLTFSISLTNNFCSVTLVLGLFCGVFLIQGEAVDQG